MLANITLTSFITIFEFFQVKCFQSDSGKRSCRPDLGADLATDRNFGNSRLSDQAMLGAKSKQVMPIFAEVFDFSKFKPIIFSAPYCCE